MQKYLWSTVLLMLATSVATYLAATRRNCPNCLGDKNVSAQVDRLKLGEVTPLVLSTQPPPFIIEPIAIEPEPRCSTPSCPERIAACNDIRPQAAMLLRMPYADEESPAWDFWTMAYGMFNQMLSETDESNWNIVTDLVQQFLPLPGSDVEPIDPGIEVPRESTPPLQQDDATNQSEMTPTPPVDNHQQHPGCPYLNGCPRGYYPTFPPPAYPFERTMPSAEPMPPPM